MYNKSSIIILFKMNLFHSKGTNLLIKSHKAHLIEHAQDLIYHLRWDEVTRNRGIQQQLFTELSEDEKIVVDLLQYSEGMGIDHLTNKAQFQPSKMAVVLLELECKGLIRSLPGNRYYLI